jgi:hypothetical protein
MTIGRDLTVTNVTVPERTLGHIRWSVSSAHTMPKGTGICHDSGLAIPRQCDLSMMNVNAHRVIRRIATEPPSHHPGWCSTNSTDAHPSGHHPPSRLGHCHHPLSPPVPQALPLPPIHSRQPWQRSKTETDHHPLSTTPSRHPTPHKANTPPPADPPPPPPPGHGRNRRFPWLQCGAKRLPGAGCSAARRPRPWGCAPRWATFSRPAGGCAAPGGTDQERTTG